MGETGFNQDDNRIHNRSLALKLIKQHPGITRTDLAEQLELSKPAITKIVNLFIYNGVIKEDSENTMRNKGLFFCNGVYFTIVIYLGRLSITGALFDLDGTVQVRRQLPKGIAFYGNDNLPSDTLNLIKMIIDDSKILSSKILAIGIAAPGAVSSIKGIVFNRSVGSQAERNNVPFNWGKIHLVEYLEEKTGLPVYIDNNSNLSALAESWFGKGLGVKNFVQYSVGIGIGGGAILNGKLYRGNDNIACEVGHTTVVYEGKVCFCGNQGCLETIAGFGNIVEQYDGCADVPGDEQLVERIEYILKKAQEKEERALRVLKEHAFRIGVGAVTLINMFSPEKLIISTNDLNDISIDILLHDVEYYIRKHAYPIISESICVEISSLGNDIHLKGAYAMILENLFSLLNVKMEESY